MCARSRRGEGQSEGIQGKAERWTTVRVDIFRSKVRLSVCLCFYFLSFPFLTFPLLSLSPGPPLPFFFYLFYFLRLYFYLRAVDNRQPETHRGWLSIDSLGVFNLRNRFEYVLAREPDTGEEKIKHF